MARTYQFDVQMSCGGCASTVTSAITALPNIQSAKASVQNQKVDVITEDIITFDQVRLAIQSTGKNVTGGRTIQGDMVKEMTEEAPATAN